MLQQYSMQKNVMGMDMDIISLLGLVTPRLLVPTRRRALMALILIVIQVLANLAVSWFNKWGFNNFNEIKYLVRFYEI